MLVHDTTLPKPTCTDQQNQEAVNHSQLIFRSDKKKKFVLNFCLSLSSSSLTNKSKTAFSGTLTERTPKQLTENRGPESKKNVQNDLKLYSTKEMNLKKSINMKKF